MLRPYSRKLLLLVLALSLSVAACSKKNDLGSNGEVVKESVSSPQEEWSAPWGQVNKNTWRMIDVEVGVVCYASNVPGDRDTWTFSCSPFKAP